MKKDYTDITVVLDRSGSMAQIAGDTIGGFNQFLEDQKKAAGTATISLHQFDDIYETVIDNKDIQSAQPLTDKTFVPRGMTALHDAIGRSINATGARISALPEDQRPEKVVFVIITDGAENASKEYDLAKVNAAITLQRETYKWEFVFLAAKQDAIHTGMSLGVAAANSMSYADNGAGTKRAFMSTSSNLKMMRSGASADMSYSAQDRQLQKDAGLDPKFDSASTAGSPA